MRIKLHRAIAGLAPLLLLSAAVVLPGCRTQHDGSESTRQTNSSIESGSPAGDTGGPAELIERARRLAKERNRDSLLESAALFERATELAPDPSPELASAWSGLADTHALIGLYSHKPAAESLALALPAAERALELIEQQELVSPATRARTLASLGLARFLWSRDFESAEDAFAQALAISEAELPAPALLSNPHDQQGFDLPQTLHWYAMLLHATGRHAEAIVRITRAAELSPDSPLLLTKLATVLIGAGHLDQAQAQLDLHRERFDSFAMLHRELGNIALARGELANAIENFTAALEHNPRDHRSLALKGQAQALAGQTQEARTAVEALESNGQAAPLSEVSIALVHVGLGDADTAIAALERARQRHEAGLVYIASRPGFSLLHETDGYTRLVAELGLR